MENNMLKWYGQVTRMEDNRWPERIMTWSPEGSRRIKRLATQYIRNYGDWKLVTGGPLES
jgi:hypothetical protein